MKDTNVKTTIIERKTIRKKQEKDLKGKRGITLVALILTIIVLLILTGVTIATLTGDNGILTRASDAKVETIVATVKENLQLEQIEKAIDEEEVTPETMLAEGKVKRTVQQAEDGNYYMYYALKEDVVEGMQGLGKGNVANLRDVFLIDDDLNVRYIAKNGKEYGDELEEKILRDETKIRFASKAFSEYVSRISGATEEEMKFEWMKNQTSLTITDTAVDSLEDLVFFPNLESLTLGEYSSVDSPNITTMDGIENCTKLTSLRIFYGPDKDYSAISKLLNFMAFYRYGGSDFNNIIEGLKLCSKLNSVTVTNQKEISDMSKISQLSNSVTEINLGNNSISKIEGLTNLTNLKILNLGGNQISKIENLDNLVNLKELYLANNKIKDITPLSVNTSLTILNLNGNTQIDGNRNNYTEEGIEALNKIGEILDRGGTINLDIDKLGLFTNYKTLDLSGQSLTTLEQLEGLTQLISLNLGNNKLTLTDEKSQEILKSMTNLESLTLETNQITSITAISSLKNLKYLNLKGNTVNLTEIENIISNLNNLTVSTESLKTIIDCNTNKIIVLNLDNSSLTELPVLSIFNKLSVLNLNNNPNINNFENVSQITNLQSLFLANNNLHGRMIDFSQLTNLTSLNLSGNTLWSEDLENLKVLRNNNNLTINLSNNSIIDATALLELNPNTKINLTGNINLSQDSKDKLKARFGNNVTF